MRIFFFFSNQWCLFLVSKLLSPSCCWEAAPLLYVWRAGKASCICRLLLGLIVWCGFARWLLVLIGSHPCVYFAALRGLFFFFFIPAVFCVLHCTVMSLLHQERRSRDLSFFSFLLFLHSNRLNHHRFSWEGFSSRSALKLRCVPWAMKISSQQLVLTLLTLQDKQGKQTTW